VPFAVPLAPDVIVSQLALLVAVHVQPVPAVTATDPVAAAALVRFDDVGEMVGAHGTVNMNVFERVLETVPPGPTDLTIDS
jgi:hypothetical protein